MGQDERWIHALMVTDILFVTGEEAAIPNSLKWKINRVHDRIFPVSSANFR